jgi:hypothetical protein
MTNRIVIPRAARFAGRRYHAGRFVGGNDDDERGERRVHRGLHRFDDGGGA